MCSAQGFRALASLSCSNGRSLTLNVDRINILCWLPGLRQIAAAMVPTYDSTEPSGACHLLFAHDAYDDPSFSSHVDGQSLHLCTWQQATESSALCRAFKLKWDVSALLAAHLEGPSRFTCFQVRKALQPTVRNFRQSRSGSFKPNNPPLEGSHTEWQRKMHMSQEPTKQTALGLLRRAGSLLLWPELPPCVCAWWHCTRQWPCVFGPRPGTPKLRTSIR